jgi:hypothetical protein
MFKCPQRLGALVRLGVRGTQIEPPLGNRGRFYVGTIASGGRRFIVAAKFSLAFGIES